LYFIPPIKRTAPTIPLSTIITTENIASRAVPGCPCPADMTAVIIITSIPVTAMVSTSVPNGSPSLTARPSACRTTAKEESITTLTSQNIDPPSTA